MFQAINRINTKDKDKDPRTKLSNISQAQNSSVVVQPLKQHEVKRSSATIVTDQNLNVISISQSYYDLYGVDPLPLPVSLKKIVCTREAAGWFALSEAFSGHDALKAFMDNVQSNQYYHDFHISSLNEVIDVTHYTDLKSGNKFFNFTPTAINIASTPEKSIEVRGMMVLRDLAMLGMFGTFPVIFGSTETEKQTHACVICDPKSGRLVFLGKANSFPKLADIQFIEDLSLDIRDIVCSLDEVGEYSGHVELEGRKPLHLALKRQFFYAGGPSFLAGKLVELWGGITADNVEGDFPLFSSKEAEVMSLLAQGHTIKETAAKLGKAQVTASLQARSALLKSGERSINALVARITHSRPKYI